MTLRLALPRWFDLHMHFRQGELLAPLAEEHRRMGCAGALAMPNTRPPVTRVFVREDSDAGWSVETYLAMLRKAWPQAKELIVPLYLSAETTPEMIAKGAESGSLRACKYYPPHGTTNAEHGADINRFVENGVLAAMQEHGVVFCVHGEMHGLSGEAYFGRSSNAEETFYREVAPCIVEKFPRLKMVAEHVTTKGAADFVRQASPLVGATVTPQHLLYTIGHLVQGCKYHLYCLPIVKYEEDREALRRAVIAPDNTQFFAGTDSAPHTVKATPCGCAAGCYTGGVAPQLYAEAFEKDGATLDDPAAQQAFKNFLCLNGARFYGLPVPDETFTLSREPQEVRVLSTATGSVIPLPIGMLAQPSESATLSWRVSA